MKNKAPRGLIIFSIVNMVLLGFIPAACFLGIAFLLPASVIEKVLQVLQEKERFLPGMDIAQFKSFLYIQACMSAMFIISGIGLFKRKQWGRRFTIYYAFFTLVMVLVGIISAGKVMPQIWFNIIYPGALIFYFTNQKVGEAFQ